MINTEVLTATNIIVAITCLISFLLMQNQAGKSMLIFHPVTISQNKQWYRFLTSGFIHADIWHLGINMFVLWSFGNAIEKYYYPAAMGELATVKYLGLYFGGIIVASIPSYLRHKNDTSAPWQDLYLYGIIAIPQILAGVAYVAYSWYKDRNSKDNIGHMAHLTGAIWGFVFTIAMNFALLTHFVVKTLEGPSWL